MRGKRLRSSSGLVNHDTEYGSEHTHIQPFVVRKATGDDALRGDVGESSVEGETGSVATDLDLCVYVGIAPYLFAANAGFGTFMTAFYKDQRFDGDAFLHQQNPFARRNVTAIVLEVPSELIGKGKSTHGRRSPSLAMRRRYKFRVGACLWLRISS